MKLLLLVLFFGAAACFLWFSLLCLRMIAYDDGKKERKIRNNYLCRKCDTTEILKRTPKRHQNLD